MAHETQPGDQHPILNFLFGKREKIVSERDVETVERYIGNLLKIDLNSDLAKEITKGTYECIKRGMYLDAGFILSFLQAITQQERFFTLRSLTKAANFWEMPRSKISQIPYGDRAKLEMYASPKLKPQETYTFMAQVGSINNIPASLLTLGHNDEHLEFLITNPIQAFEQVKGHQFYPWETTRRIRVHGVQDIVATDKPPSQKLRRLP